jgi:hypothetical protein
MIFHELPMRRRQCDDCHPSALHTLFVFEGFVAVARTSNLPASAALNSSFFNPEKPAPWTVTESNPDSLPRKPVRKIFVKQAMHLRDALQTVPISEGDKLCDLIAREGRIILADLFNGATQFPFFYNLIGGNACAFDQWNTSLFTGDSLHQLATSPVDLFKSAHWLTCFPFSRMSATLAPIMTGGVSPVPMPRDDTMGVSPYRWLHRSGLARTIYEIQIRLVSRRASVEDDGTRKAGTTAWDCLRCATLVPRLNTNSLVAA